MVNEAVTRFEQDGYKTVLSKITEWTQPSNAEPPAGDSDSEEVLIARVEYVSMAGIPVGYDKPWLESEQDIDKYLEEFKMAMLAIISEDITAQL